LKTISNLTKGIILFAIIYFLVFFLALGISNLRTSFVANSSNSLAANTLNSALPTPTAQSSSHDIYLLIGEIFVVSVIAILEMRWKLISITYHYIKSLFKNVHPLLREFLIVGLFIILFYWILLKLGFFAFIFLAINFGGVALVNRIFLKKLTFAQKIPIFFTFIFFVIAWVLMAVVSISINNLYLTLFTDFAYFPLTFLISAIFMRNPTKNTLNTVAFISSIMVAIFTGLLFKPFFAYALLFVFSIYDFIAVFWTKHMGFMAKKLIAYNIPEVFIIGDMELIKARMAELNTGVDKTKIPESIRPLIIGVGDAALPAVVIVAFVFGKLPMYGLMVAIGASLGVFFNMKVLNKYRGVIPALPLILIGITIMIGLLWSVNFLA